MRSSRLAGAATSTDTDEGRLPLRDAAADPRGADTAAAAAQLVQQRHEDAASRRADGMADRDGAAVDVDDAGVDLEHLRARDGDGGEGLVDLHEVETVRIDRAARLPHRILDR